MNQRSQCPYSYRPTNQHKQCTGVHNAHTHTGLQTNTGNAPAFTMPILMPAYKPPQAMHRRSQCPYSYRPTNHHKQCTSVHNAHTHTGLQTNTGNAPAFTMPILIPAYKPTLAVHQCSQCPYSYRPTNQHRQCTGVHNAHTHTGLQTNTGNEPAFTMPILIPAYKPTQAMNQRSQCPYSYRPTNKHKQCTGVHNAHTHTGLQTNTSNAPAFTMPILIPAYKPPQAMHRRSQCPYSYRPTNQHWQCTSVHNAHTHTGLQTNTGNAPAFTMPILIPAYKPPQAMHQRSQCPYSYRPTNQHWQCTSVHNAHTHTGLQTNTGNAPAFTMPILIPAYKPPQAMHRRSQCPYSYRPTNQHWQCTSVHNAHTHTGLQTNTSSAPAFTMPILMPAYKPTQAMH